MEWEDWVKLGMNLKNAEGLIRKGYYLDPRPKTQKRTWDRARKLMTSLKSVLDDLVCREYSEIDAVTRVFYGPKEGEPQCHR